MDRVAAVLRGAPRRRALLSVSVAVPQLRLDGPQAKLKDYIYWGRPAEGGCAIAVGSATCVQAAGAGRLQRLDQTLSRYRRDWTHLDPEGVAQPPWALIVFAFDRDDPMDGAWQGLPNATLRVPALLLRCRNDETVLTFTCCPRGDATPEQQWRRCQGDLQCLLDEGVAWPPAPGRLKRGLELPGPQAWRGMVEHALQDIRAGRLSKVVLARSVGVSRDRHFVVAEVLRALARLTPEGTHMAVAQGASSLVAASPERLVSVRGARVECDALAGTVARGAGDAEHPGRGAQCDKTRREHALVLDAVTAALRGACTDLQWPARPKLLRLHSLEHLWTPVSARRYAGVSVLDLAAHLHPTPAVGGSPTASALDWLRVHPDCARGWYAGAVGWLDSAGDGELAVVLRCALLRGAFAILYAGAGVVAGSEPEQELAETELKLSTMLAALADG